jgi:hypothetical protein
MMKTSISGTASIFRYIGLVLLLFAPMHRESPASETTNASGHICSGCPACDQPAVSAPQPIEHGCIDPFHRAGHPETQGRFAKPSLNQHYSFGYVGGGAAFRGEPRSADEGTWGVDYSGILFKRKIWLHWLHGHREPRGEGSYQTDGPHLLPH